MSRLIDTAPERIFLCVSDDLADINRPFPEVYPEDEPITWATNWTVAASVCYVREDMHNEAMAVLRDRAGHAEADLAAAWAKIASLRHHVKALQILCKSQHAPQDMNLFAAEVDAIDAALAGKDTP